MSTRVRYQMDPKLSQLTVHAFASGLAAVVAHNPKFAIRDFSGDAEFSPGTLDDASIRLRSKSSSLDLMDEVSEYDRREIARVTFDEVLEISRFPEIAYESERISATQLGENLFGANIKGNLTLHGVRGQVEFTAQVVVGDDTLRGYGNFSVKQTEYGIAIASIAGGTLKMKDELKIAFFIIAKKQE
ncbi:MAG TPA: YceI family protein [Candidatus Acidoferrales bacterium]